MNTAYVYFMHFNFYIHEGQILGNTVNTGEASMNKNFNA